MGARPIKILCTGDLHLGRYPSRVDTNLRQFSGANIWARTVDLAISEAVELVVLTGDIVDRDNRFFEAIGPLEQGIRRLGAAGITTYAVAGNHDFDVLPRLADALSVDSFQLLGGRGVWETRVFERDGKPTLRLVGWSFPAQHFPQSPLDTLSRPEPDGIPTVGILHADLDAGASRYAPVRGAELGAYGFSAWLLGHIHRPFTSRASGDSLLLYPGSPQPLDPGERGAHGPWLVEVGPAGRAKARQIALASLRYEEVEVDLSSMQRADEFDAMIVESIRARLQQWARQTRESSSQAYLPERANIRLRLVGRTRFRREIEPVFSRIIQDFELPVETIVARVEQIQVDTRPALDLAEIARGNDPPALLARLLIELEAGAPGAAYQPLFMHLRHQVAQVQHNHAFALLRAEQGVSDEVDAAHLRRLVRDEGLRLLDELLAQKRSDTELIAADGASR